MTWSARLAVVLALLTLTWAACSGQPSQAALGGACMVDTDCAEPAVCINSVCAMLPPCECTSDSDCPGDFPFCDGCSCTNPGGPANWTGGASGAGGQSGSGGAGTGGAGGHAGGGGAGTGGA